MLKVLELFAGIGACSKALDNIGIEHEIVDAVEIDKYAVKSFNAIHDTNFEPQDITKWDKDIQVDLIMHGSPCQDFSVAGRQAGGDKDSGTRSSLMYETLRIVEKLKPKYVIWENVKNLLSKKHRHNFDAYLEAMEKLGYTNFYKVLNAKNYGVPQNRERVFTISMREREYEWPEPFELEKRLKDMLEDVVDEKYYLTDEKTSSFVSTIKEPCVVSECGKKIEKTTDIATTLLARDYKGFGNQAMTGVVELEMVGKCEAINGHDLLKRVYSSDGLSPTLSTMGGGNTEPKIIDPFVVASRGRGENNEQHAEPRKDGLTNTITSVQKDNLVALPGAYGRNFGSRGKIQNVDGASCTLLADMGTGGGNVPLVPNERMRIRKLTPLECWRLMGFDDSDFKKAEKVNSNTQLYKQAGNSIVVKVLEKILYNLLKEEDGKTVTV
jgi:DNA (cytosine-5)-methyltransferase 1